MLDARSDDVSFGWRRSSGCNYPEDGMVIGFGASASKDDFLSARADQRRDLLASSLHRGASRLPKSMDGGAVAVFRGEVWKHCLEHFGRDARRGIVIQVDAVHGSASA